MRLAWLVVVGLVGACADSTVDDPCIAAEAHIMSCTDEQSAATMTCDLDRANAVLQMDCNELVAAAAAGKSDGWWNDLLCDLGFATHCSGGGGGGSGSGSGSGEVAMTRTLAGQVLNTLQQGATNVYVRATREGTSETRGTWVVSGLFALTDVPVAKYTLEVSVTTTSAAIATATVDLATQTYVVIHAPVP